MNNEKGKKDLFFDTENHYFNYFKKEQETNTPQAICKDNFPIEFFSVVALMSQDCNFQIRKCYNNFSRLFIEGCYKSQTNELMLRYGDGGRLIVARVCFIHQRKGNMSELYRLLKIIRRKHKTDKIVIESVQTDEMKAWCIKHDFVKMENSNNYIEK